MWSKLRLPEESDDALYDLQQDSFCGCCEATIAFSGTVSALGINYLQGFLHLLASGLDDRGSGTVGCGMLPWMTTRARKASPETEALLVAANLLLVRSLLRARGERAGLLLIASAAAKAETHLAAIAFPRAPLDALGESADAWPDAFGAIFGRLGVDPSTGRAFGRMLWLLQWLEPGTEPDWLEGRRGDLDEAALRRELASRVCEVRGDLARLPLGATRGAVLAVLDGILAPRSLPAPKPKALARIKLRVFQSGPSCAGGQRRS